MTPALEKKIEIQNGTWHNTINNSLFILSNTCESKFPFTTELETTQVKSNYDKKYYLVQIRQETWRNIAKNDQKQTGDKH